MNYFDYPFTPGDFDTNDYYSFFPQLICLGILTYFSIRSLIIIWTGFKQEHKEQGTIPVLAYIYMAFSFIFTIKFLFNFGEITEVNRNIFNTAITGVGNESFYINSFNLVFSCVLVAFTTNFCKSFFTMNSLEFGYINGMQYGKLFASKSIGFVFIDSIFRMLSALFFIKIEHNLSLEENYKSANNLFSFISEIGEQAMWMYGCILAWLIFNWIFLHNYQIINRAWYIWTLVQFIGGLFLGGSLIFFGTKGTVDNYKEIVLMVTPFIILGMLTVITCIVAIEIISLRNKSAFTPPPVITPNPEVKTV